MQHILFQQFHFEWLIISWCVAISCYIIAGVRFLYTG